MSTSGQTTFNGVAEQAVVLIPETFAETVVVPSSSSSDELVPLDRLRADHIAHLLERTGLSAPIRKMLVAQAHSASTSHRHEALNALERAAPGSLERLRNLWTAYGRHALFLFRTRALQGMAHAQVHHLLSSSLRRSADGAAAPALLKDGRWNFVPVGRGDASSKERVHKFRLDGGRLITVIRMARSQTYVHEEEEASFAYTYDVQVVLQLDTFAKRAEVYGAQTDGKRSMRALLQWLLGEEVPSRNPKQSRFFVPVEFTEAEVKSLAARHGLELVGMEGSDSKGVIGKVGYRGKNRGLSRQALDLADSRVRSQDAHPQDVRTYRFTFDHAQDGFIEHSLAEFSFGKRHQRLSFPIRATKPAMEQVIERLYRHVCSDD